MDFQEAIEKRIKFYTDECRQPEAKAEGNAFEDLCAFYLENGPWGKEHKAHVDPWSLSSLRRRAANDRDRSIQDKGCDLVVQVADGSYYMVQCKYYPKSTLTLDGAHLSNIFSMAPRYSVPDDHIAFCYIADSVSKNAEDVLKFHTCFNESSLLNPAFDWGPMFGREREKKKLWGYQREAVDACVRGFKAEEDEGKKQVGKLVMACGTGKTFTSFSLARTLSDGKPYTVLFLAPSIALVSSTFQDWGIEADGGISSLIICSDSKANKFKGEDEIESLCLPFPVWA